MYIRKVLEINLFCVVEIPASWKPTRRAGQQTATSTKHGQCVPGH